MVIDNNERSNRSGAEEISFGAAMIAHRAEHAWL
jgi:hypothetical protein